MLDGYAQTIIDIILDVYQSTFTATLHPRFVTARVIAELARFRNEFEQDMWIPVARQLPKVDGGTALLLTNGHYICQGYYDVTEEQTGEDTWEVTGAHFETDGEGFRLDDVTHYRPLPALPRF